MKDVRLTHLVSFFFLLVTWGAWAVDRVKVDVFRLHPTQSLIGFREVEWRKVELRRLLKKGAEDLKKYLKEEPGEVVKGPQNTLWLVDGHHHARALAELKREELFKPFEYYADVVQDWSGFSLAEFERAMRKGKKGRPYVYLKDWAGMPIPFHSLPSNLESLRDFRLRSVVWLLEKAGAIRKVDDYPFQELVIGSRLLGEVEVRSPYDDSAYLAAVREALVFLEDAEPKIYPGLQAYSSGEIDMLVADAKDYLAHK